MIPEPQLGISSESDKVILKEIITLSQKSAKRSKTIKLLLCHHIISNLSTGTASSLSHLSSRQNKLQHYAMPAPKSSMLPGLVIGPSSVHFLSSFLPGMLSRERILLQVEFGVSSSSCIPTYLIPKFSSQITSLSQLSL